MNTSVETITVKLQRKALDLITSTTSTTSNTNPSQKTDQSKSPSKHHNTTNIQNNNHKTHITQNSANNVDDATSDSVLSTNTQVILKDQMTSPLPIFKPETLLSSDHSLVAVYCFVKNFIG